MNDELISRLRRLQRVAWVMRSLMLEAQAAAPARCEAKDGTGTVTVVLGAEGIPTEIKVTPDWRRRLGGRAVGAAVMDAGGRAAIARTRAWHQALLAGVWARKVERMMASGPDDPGTPDAEMPQIPEMLRREAESRSLGGLSDAMVKALGSGRPSAEDSPRFHGANRKRTVAIGLDSSGMTGCLVDNTWAGRQSASGLSAALNEALASAKAALSAAAEQAGTAQAMDTLLAETVSLLGNAERLANS